MIFLRKISLINFISHANTEIEFNSDDKILIDGVSGSGKSSIVEAIIWCLYGEGRSQNRNLIKKGRTESTVTLYLENDGVFYRIKRNINSKGSQGVEIYSSLDGTTYGQYVSSGIKESQEWIEKELIGASYNLFINSVVYLQDRANHFINKSSVEKKDLLMEIIGLNHLDEYLSKSKEKASEIKNNIISLEAIINEKKNNLSGLNLSLYNKKELSSLCDKLKAEKSRLEGIKTNLSEWFSLIDGKRFILLNDQPYLDSLRCSLDRRSIVIKEKRNLINRLNERVNFNSMELKILESSIKNVKDKIEKINSQQIDNFEIASKRMAIMADKPNIIDYDYEINRVKDQLEPLVKKTLSCKRFNEPCPYCGDDCELTKGIKQQVQFFKDEIARLEERKIQQLKDIDFWSQRINSVPIEKEIDMEEKKQLESSIIKMNEDLSILKAEEEDINKIKDHKFSLTVYEVEERDSIIALKNHDYKILSILEEIDWTNMETKIDDMETNNKLLKSIEESISNCLVSLRMADIMNEQVNTLTEDITGLENDYRASSDDLKAINNLITALGPNGIRSMVIDHSVPRLERKINEILSLLSNFRVKIETQRSKASGDGNIEGLFINIINEGGQELDFENYSGGEKLKIVVAISEALASMQKVGFRIFDELFVGLDEDSTIGFAAIMEKLQSRFKQVICISHLRSIKDTFDKIIEVKKINGSSSLSS